MGRSAAATAGCPRDRPNRSCNSRGAALQPPGGVVDRSDGCRPAPARSSTLASLGAAGEQASTRSRRPSAVDQVLLERVEVVRHRATDGTR